MRSTFSTTELGDNMSNLNELKLGSTRLLGVVLILLAACLGSFAQSISGDLSGTVYDASGAAIPNATVSGKNDATGVVTVAKSSAAGDYRLSNLPPGTYTVTVTAQGFTKAEVRGVVVVLSKNVTTNVKLDVGTNVATVEVTAAAAALDTSTANVQTSFESQSMAEIPAASSGSGVINLSLLSAGVSSSGTVGVGSGPSVGGQRPRNNNFTIEGVDNNSGSVTGPLVQVPNDAVAEFTLQQNQISAEFGHSSGGQFNQVIISGTNQFHGEAYEYFQNRNLDAADNLSAVNGNELHPRYDNNRFGGAFGGPIKKNKVFFYGLYEYNPVGQSATPGTLYSPTAAGWATLAGISGINPTNLSQLKTYLGTAPTAVSTADFGAYPLVGPGNASLGNQAATAKSIEVGQISLNSPAYTNNEAGVGSLDVNFSDKDSLRGRFILNRSGFIDSADEQLPVFFNTVPVNTYLATVSEFHTFSPTIVNEFRFGYSRQSNSYPAGNHKWPGLDQFPNVEIFELGAQIGPDTNAPQGGAQNQYQLTDNVAVTRGAHNLKFGFDGWDQISPQSFTQRSRGDYEWNYLSDYLFDYTPDYIAERTVGGKEYYGNRIFLGFFVNDSWKVTPNLTVNVGLRYEYQTVPLTERDQTVNAISDVPGVLVFQKVAAYKNAWMPRVGLAYSPGHSGKTSIRAGFGRSFDVLFDNLGLLSLPPQDSVTVDRYTSAEDTGGFMAGGAIPPTASAPTYDAAYFRSHTGGYVPNQIRPESLQWNLSVQRVLHENYTFESRYLGTRGIHLPVQAQLNKVPVIDGTSALPVFASAQSQATLDGLTSNLTALGKLSAVDPLYSAAGFTSTITSYQPWGNSTYHGWANQLTRRFSNGLQFVAAYTFSHNIDDSTAEVFSTYTTPRRPQNIRDLKADRSSSALDHRNRFTYEVLYTTNWFKTSSNWALRNLVGNWEIAPTYTYQTGNWYTVQSGVDSNMNGDSGGDRASVVAGGNPKIGSGTTPLKNSSGAVVGYLINNPSAGYYATPKGAIATAGRNTMRMNPINNFDATIAKNLSIGERYKLQFSGRMYNLFNHSQYVGGYINDVAPASSTGSSVHSFTIPGNSLFNQDSQVFSSNPRYLILTAKLRF
jgi:hypothetical protein